MLEITICDLKDVSKQADIRNEVISESTMSIIPAENIASRIYMIRDQNVMLDSDLAELYGVTTSALNQQVRRNMDRFPEDFAFQMSPEEYVNLTSQVVMSSFGRHGGRRRPPLVFTEQGVAMLSSVLRSQQAVQVNVAIMRTFVRLRELLQTDRALARRVEEHDQKITVLIDTVQQLLTLPQEPKKNQIGFTKPQKQ